MVFPFHSYQTWEAPHGNGNGRGTQGVVEHRQQSRGAVAVFGATGVRDAATVATQGLEDQLSHSLLYYTILTILYIIYIYIFIIYILFDILYTIYYIYHIDYILYTLYHIHYNIIFYYIVLYYII